MECAYIRVERIIAGCVLECRAMTKHPTHPELSVGYAPSMNDSRLFTFAAGDIGMWSVIRMNAVKGEPLAPANRLDVVNGPLAISTSRIVWKLRGITSNARYTTQAEKAVLVAKQAPIGRDEATLAALIPIRKSAAWWDLPQDERRRIFEDSSRHTQTGLKYLPAIARRLHHCRDLSTAEPFDFLTWFDYAPAFAAAFEDLVGELRATEEWAFVEREVDIRLVNADR